MRTRTDTTAASSRREPLRGPAALRSCRGPCRSRRTGFTMIELMVVIAIIVLAAGLMGPTLANFLKNRQIEGVRGQFGNLFNTARLQAVTRRRDVSIVFFREGPRIFDERGREFTDEDVWNPSATRLGEANAVVWYALGFATGISSIDSRFDEDPSYRPDGLSIPPFEKWLAEQAAARDRGGSRSRSRDDEAGRLSYDTAGLYKVTFQRDGSLRFGPGGTDIPTSIFNDPSGTPPLADIVILQLDGVSACFIDLRVTGQVRSKIAPLATPPQRVGDVAVIGEVIREDERAK